MLYDRGYRGYDGPRAGRASAIWALFVYSLRRAVGIGRRWTAKILPAILYLIAFAPVFLVIGLRAVLGPALGEGPGYEETFGILLLVVLIFAATAAPELLCDDRRLGVLALYFARPISRGDYLLAKLGALAALLLSVTALPMLIQYAGNVLLASDAPGYARDHAGDPLRLLALSGLIALYYAAIALAIAAVIDRKGIAAAVFAGVVLIGGGVIAAIHEILTASWRDYLTLLSPIGVGDNLTAWILRATTETPSPYPRAWFLVSVLAAVLICAVVLYRRYLRED
jgi:ABC-2 type transport system permease protein